MKDGAENLLQVFETQVQDAGTNLRKQVEVELSTAKAKISAITKKLEQLQQSSMFHPITRFDLSTDHF